MSSFGMVDEHSQRMRGDVVVSKTCCRPAIGSTNDCDDKVCEQKEYVVQQ
jgi:hypothetical protein